MILNSDWQGKLISTKGILPDESQTKIFNYFKRKEIIEHAYNADHLFKLFYSNSNKPKRQPNAFMIMRAILGLVADEKKIKEKLGDGTQQSKLAGLIWGGANDNEKTKFKLLARQFKKLHETHFPNYSFKPRPRSSEVGAVVDIKTAEDYKNTNTSNWSITNLSPNTFEQPDDLNKNLLIYGTAYEEPNVLDINRNFNLQQFDPPSIAVNCLAFSQDPNTSRMTALGPYSHPYDPSSTFTSIDDRYHTSKSY